MFAHFSNLTTRPPERNPASDDDCLSIKQRRAAGSIGAGCNWRNGVLRNYGASGER